MARVAVKTAARRLREGIAFAGHGVGAPSPRSLRTPNLPSGSTPRTSGSSNAPAFANAIRPASGETTAYAGRRAVGMLRGAGRCGRRFAARHRVDRLRATANAYPLTTLSLSNQTSTRRFRRALGMPGGIAFVLFSGQVMLSGFLLTRSLPDRSLLRHSEWAKTRALVVIGARRLSAACLRLEIDRTTFACCSATGRARWVTRSGRGAASRAKAKAPPQVFHRHPDFPCRTGRCSTHNCFYVRQPGPSTYADHPALCRMKGREVFPPMRWSTSPDVLQEVL